MTSLRTILVNADTDLLELLFGLISFLWGLSLLLRPATFASDPAAYGAMAAVAPEWAWALVMLAMGLTRWFAVITRKRRVRAWVALAAGGIWLFVATMFVIANLYQAAPLVYIPLAVFNFLVFLRLNSRDTVIG